MSPSLKRTPLNRRQWLGASGAGLLGMAGLSLGANARVWAAPAWPGDAALAASPRLVVVFLRGAVDGLSVVAPYDDANYRAMRPGIALAAPGQSGGALPLQARAQLAGGTAFGLHPALAELMPLWQQRQLAFVHASGSTDTSRSHFAAQDLMETALPGSARSGQDGWMNRLLVQLWQQPANAALPQDHRLSAINVGSTLPRILQGRAEVATLAQGRNANRQRAIDKTQAQATFDALYSGQDALAHSYRDAVAQRQALRQELGSMDEEQRMANNGAAPPKNLVLDARHLGALMQKNAAIRLGFLAVGGWDTHVNQGDGSKGSLYNNLQALGKGLVQLQQALGNAWAETTVLVVSEFGRTVRQNGTGGTDHGHGNVMWVMGGKVRGGHIYGDWPGLDANALYQNRDLAITTDYRAVVATALQSPMRLPQRAIQAVLPQEGAFLGSQGLRGLFA